MRLDVTQIGPLFACNSTKLEVLGSLSLSIEQEVAWTFRSIEHSLSALNIHMSSIAHINVYVQNISEFAQMNAIYGKFFISAPPTRATVQVRWAEGKYFSGKRLLIDCLGVNHSFSSDIRKKNLHVQSISKWAPACIGPYAQANVLRLPVPKKANDDEDTKAYLELVTLAGQIALEPFIMKVEGGTAHSQLEMGFRHQLAVEKALQVNSFDTLLQVIYTTTSDKFTQIDTQSSYRTQITLPALPRGALSEIQSVLFKVPSPSAYHELHSPSRQMCCHMTGSSLLSALSITATGSSDMESLVADYIQFAMSSLLEVGFSMTDVLSWKIFCPPHLDHVILGGCLESILNAAKVDSVSICYVPIVSFPRGNSLESQILCSKWS